MALKRQFGDSLILYHISLFCARDTPIQCCSVKQTVIGQTSVNLLHQDQAFWNSADCAHHFLFSFLFFFYFVFSFFKFSFKIIFSRNCADCSCAYYSYSGIFYLQVLYCIVWPCLLRVIWLLCCCCCFCGLFF